MNDKLKNRVIYVGRSESGRRLAITISDGTTFKTVMEGEIGSVPNGVSRWKPDQCIAHCKISVAADGSMVITNMVGNNTTYVNGVSVVEKSIKESDTVLLGSDKFTLNISEVLSVAEKLLSGKPAGGGSGTPGKEYDTTPMAAVWDRYHSETLAMKKNQRRINNYRMSIVVVGVIYGALTAIIRLDSEMQNQNQDNTLGTIFTCISAAIAIWCLYKGFFDKTIEKTDELTEWMQDNYVYPCCTHYAGLQAYRVIRQNKNCPFCKAKLKHKEN